MKIGLSLPPNYLAGQRHTSDAQALWDAYGPPEACLAELRSYRLESVELRHIGGACDVDMAEAAARCVIDAGLEITVHAMLPRDVEGASFTDAFPALARVTRMLHSRRQRELVVTVHGYAEKDGDVSEVRDRTVQAMKRVMQMVDDERLRLRFALELKRKKRNVDPSNGYESLVGMIRQICHPSVGVCWDLGHAYANVLNHYDPLDPPASFVRQVIHTHIHGMGADGKTHCPLTADSLPLTAFVGPLSQTGYSGVFNLELNPARVAAMGDLRDQVRDSISYLGSSSLVLV